MALNIGALSLYIDIIQYSGKISIVEFFLKYRFGFEVGIKRFIFGPLYAHFNLIQRLEYRVLS